MKLKGKVTRKNIIWLVLAIAVFGMWFYLLFYQFNITATNEELQEYSNIAIAILNGEEDIVNKLSDDYNIVLNEGKLSISTEKLGCATVHKNSKDEIIVKCNHEYFALFILTLVITIITIFSIVASIGFFIDINAAIQKRENKNKK